MSQRISGYARKADDLYETPAWVVGVLAQRLPDRVQTIWEPAPGSGKLASALHELGYDVVISRGDYFMIDKPPQTIDAIITNPPFGPAGKTAAQFARKALKHAHFVALLLRVDFDSGKTRTDLFRDCPWFLAKLVLLDRIRWFPGESGPSDNHAWYLWDRRHQGPPSIWYQRNGDTPDSAA